MQHVRETGRSRQVVEHCVQMFPLLKRHRILLKPVFLKAAAQGLGAEDRSELNCTDALPRRAQSTGDSGDTMTFSIDLPPVAGASASVLKRVHLQRLMAFAVALALSTFVSWQLLLCLWTARPGLGRIFGNFFSISVGALRCFLSRCYTNNLASWCFLTGGRAL